MFYTYFSARGIDVAAYTSAGRLASRIAYDAPSFETRAEAEAWIRDIGNPRYAAEKEKDTCGA